jgi:hypothetical protein
MANYRVFVPSRKGSGKPDLTISIEASNWLVALKASLNQLGEQGDNLSNILCETAEDGTLRVADPDSRRVFLIQELAGASRDLEKEAEENARKSRKEAEEAEEVRRKAMATLEKLRKEDVLQATAAQSATREKAKHEAEVALSDAKRKAEVAADKAADDATGTVGEIKVEVGRKDKKWEDLDDWYSEDDKQPESELDGAISDVFMSTEALYTMEEEDAMSFILDQAIKHVASEAGSVFQIMTNSALQDLKIVAARGPVGKKIEGLTLPRGKGIVGFSALKSLKLVVNNVQRNPNFYGGLDKQFGFKTTSLLCVPLVFEGMLYGVLEMVNKKHGQEWTNNDLKIVEVLADMLAKAINYRRSLGKL